MYWRWLVTKVPLWVAPNLLTFVGLLINILTTVPIVIYDYNAEGLVSGLCGQGAWDLLLGEWVVVAGRGQV